MFLQVTRKIDTKSGWESSIRPSSATLKIGSEVFKSEHKYTARARHAVMIKTLNETGYRFTNIPEALRSYTVDETIKSGNKTGIGVRNEPQSAVMDKQDRGVRDKLDSTSEVKDTPDTGAIDKSFSGVKDTPGSSGKDKTDRSVMNKLDSGVKDKPDNILEPKPSKQDSTAASTPKRLSNQESISVNSVKGHSKQESTPISDPNRPSKQELTPVSVSKEPGCSMNEEFILSKNKQYIILSTTPFATYLTAGICDQLLGLLAEQNHVRYFHIHINFLTFEPTCANAQLALMHHFVSVTIPKFRLEKNH